MEEPEWSRVWSFTVATSTDVEGATLPGRFSLHPDYPNPFNPETTMRFDPPSTEDVRLEVFDMLGRRVASLVDGRLPAGTHRVPWRVGHLASGLYCTA